MMLRIWVELVPGGMERIGKQIASATIGNIGGTPRHADYRYRLASGGSPYAPAFSHEGGVTGHDRWQSVWALVWAMLDDWWAMDGCKFVTSEPGSAGDIPCSCRSRRDVLFSCASTFDWDLGWGERC